MAGRSNITTIQVVDVTTPCHNAAAGEAFFMSCRMRCPCAEGNEGASFIEIPQAG